MMMDGGEEREWAAPPAGRITECNCTTQQSLDNKPVSAYYQIGLIKVPCSLVQKQGCLKP